MGSLAKIGRGAQKISGCRGRSPTHRSNESLVGWLGSCASVVQPPPLSSGSQNLRAKTEVQISRASGNQLEVLTPLPNLPAAAGVASSLVGRGDWALDAVDPPWSCMQVPEPSNCTRM